MSLKVSAASHHITSHSALDPVPTLEFRDSSEDPAGLHELTTAFRRTLEPLYGPQESALEKIRQGKDRKALLLYEKKGRTPVGTVVYKTGLTNEFADKGVKDSLEIKSLFLFDPVKSSGRGLGSALLERVVKVAEQMHAPMMHVTVSDEKPESVQFFKKHRFEVVETYDGKYKTGHKEFLLRRILESQSSQMPEYSFQRIFGETRKERLDHVCELFQKWNPEARKDLDEIRKGSTFDGRLLCDRDNSVGAIVYKKKLSQEHAAQGLRDTFDVQAILTEGSQAHHMRTITELFEKALEKAKDLEAKALCVTVRRNDRALSEFLHSRKFTEIKNSSDGNTLFALKLVEPAEKPKPSTLPPQRVQQSSVTTMSTQQKNRQGLSENPWQMTLRKQYIHMIQRGDKTIEGRINSGIFTKYQEGDFVRFFYQQNPNDDVLCKITKKAVYKSFPEMLQKEEFKKCLPDVASRDKAVEVYHNLPGFEERARKSGVLALHIERIRRS